MQAYEMVPLPVRAPRVRRQAALSPIDLLEPILLLLVAPLVLAPERFAPKTIGLGLALLLLPYLLRWIFYGAPSVSTLADLPLILLFCVVTPISLWVTPYFWEKSWPELVRMLWGGAVMLAVINWAVPLWRRVDHTPAAHYRLHPRLWLLTFAYVGVSVALALVGLLNMNVMTKIPFVEQAAAQIRQLEVSSLTLEEQFNPNRVAAALVMVVPLPLAFLLSGGRNRPPVTNMVTEGAPLRRKRRLGVVLLQMVASGLWRLLGKTFWLALWLFFAGGLLLTQSRAGLLAAAVGTLVVLLCTWRQPDGWLRLVGGLFLILFLVGMGYSLLAIEYRDFFQGAVTTLDSTSQKMVNTASFSGRLIIWQRALHGIADQPLTGMGLAAFDQIAHEPYPLAGFIPGDIHHAHNLFLQTGLDFGLPGMILFLAIVVLAATSLISLYRAVPPDGQLSVWAIAMLGCFVAFLLYNLLDALTLGARPAVALWFLLGLALSARRQVAEKTQSVDVPHQPYQLQVY